MLMMRRGGIPKSTPTTRVLGATVFVFAFAFVDTWPLCTGFETAGRASNAVGLWVVCLPGGGNFCFDGLNSDFIMPTKGF